MKILRMFNNGKILPYKKKINHLLKVFICYSNSNWRKTMKRTKLYKIRLKFNVIRPVKDLSQNLKSRILQDKALPRHN